MAWLIILELVLAAAGILLASRHSLHMFQLESYQTEGYRNHLMRYPSEWKGWTLTVAFVCEVAQWVLPVFFSLITGDRHDSTVISHLIIAAYFAVYAGINIYKDFTAKQKKPLVFTKRMKRLAATQAGVIIVLLGVMSALFVRYDSESKLVVMRVFSPFALTAALPWLINLSAAIIKPVEDKINLGFFNAARDKLAANKNCIRVGITGSYGKTSTKFALTTILSVKYNVLTSESSINTPMGLSKLINTRFDNSVEVFVAEMGARHVGDIAELATLVKPQIGLITSIGPQHLDTFKTVETVAKTKNELIKALPKDGAGFFASDGAYVDGLYEKCSVEKHLTAADKKDERTDMWAEDVTTGPFGCRFTLCDKDGGRVTCESQLLRRHSVSNIVLCCAVAKKLGMTLEEIARGVSLIKPIEHRMQIIRGALTVLDDAFNSNPVGAAEALTILKTFPGRHLVVTPGMVEMGENEDKFNYEFGRQIAENCDAAILVGPKHTKPIYDGMKAAGFDDSRVSVVKTLEEATALISRYAGSGDTVLFENDLPDNYAE